MGLQLPGDSGWWGNIEALAIASAGAIAAAAGLLWRITWKIGQMDAAIKTQRQDFTEAKARTEAAIDKMTEAVNKLREDHHELHSELVAQPTKVDLRDVEGRISNRFDRLSAQVDRLVESRMAGSRQG